jgi:tetratricopeptide (TPR) repeat protein
VKLARALSSWLALAVLLSAAPQGSECRSELTKFVDLLGALRKGDDVATELRASAERLCSTCDRCDARNVAEFYAALDPDARRQGLLEEQRFGALREEVAAASHASTPGPQWAQQRVRIVSDLRALADRASAQPDFVPAARALSLIARIEVERIEEDANLVGEQRLAALAEAERDARAAIELFDNAGQMTPRLEPDWLLARLAAVRGEHDDARASFERVLEKAEHVGNDDFRENALRGVLSLANAAGDVRLEARTLERIATFRDLGQSWLLARDWAAHLIHDDNAAGAVEFLGEHAPSANARVIDRIEWELLMGSAQLRLGDTQAARPHFERVAQGPTPEVAVLALATLALREHRGFEVLALLDDEQRLAKFSLKGRSEGHALLGEALLGNGDVQRAQHELSAALALADTWETGAALESVRGTAAGAAGSVIGERLGLHTIALLAFANSQLGLPLEAVRVIENSHARSLRRRTDDGAVERLAASDITNWAAQFELGFVTWVVGADFTVVAHVATDADGVAQAHCERIPHGRDAMQEAARRLREAALAGNADHLARLSAEIRSALFPSSINALLRTAAEAKHEGKPQPEKPRLLLIAHGLEEMPFELLDIAELCGRADMALLVLPGLPEREPGSSPAAAGFAHWSLLGDPLDTSGVKSLPGARDELTALAELHPGSQLISGVAFDHAHVTQALGLNLPLHIATHLLPTCETEDSAYAPSSLLLSDGAQLCVREIAKLRPHAPLVVLSACASGGGNRVDAEGLQGMARAFLDSGTRNLLVTTWPVEDGAAADFALAFHRALMQGLCPSRAAESARRELQSAGFGPADWAAFRLLGRD